MIVVIFFRGQPADNKIAAAKRFEPASLGRSEQFLLGEEFFF